MMSRFGRHACLTLLVCAGMVWTAGAAAQTTNPVAFVYVATVNTTNGTGNNVVGYSAASDGKLTTIPGSPWADQIYWMAATHSYLFGSDNIANDKIQYIFRYQIESNGALKYIGATDIQDKGSGNVCNDGQFLTLDHTGSYLYQQVAFVNCASNGSAYESWAVNKETGLLNYLGTSKPNDNSTNLYPLTIAADNLYAYSAACGENSEPAGNTYRIQSNGDLLDLSLTRPLPSGQPSSASSYTPCLNYATADPTNHIAVAVDWMGNNTYPNQIATYAINTTTGAVTTNSSYSNMPSAEVNTIRWMAMSPSGKVLAVAGWGGLQLFNFNPSGQATKLTGLLTTQDIIMCTWDNAGHLYALVPGGPGTSGGSLHVYTVTTSGATEATGSPYSIPLGKNLIVQSR